MGKRKAELSFIPLSRSFFSDGRFDVLAKERGEDSDDTRMKFLRVVDKCFGEFSSELSRSQIQMAAKLPPRAPWFADELVAVDLAIPVGDGLYRISGADDRLAAVDEGYAKRSEHARRAAAARWEQERNPNARACPSMPEQCSTMPEHAHALLGQCSTMPNDANTRQYNTVLDQKKLEEECAAASRRSALPPAASAQDLAVSDSDFLQTETQIFAALDPPPDENKTTLPVAVGTSVVEPPVPALVRSAPKPSRKDPRVPRCIGFWVQTYEEVRGTRPSVKPWVVKRILEAVGSEVAFQRVCSAFLQMQGEGNFFERRGWSLECLEANLDVVLLALSRGDPNAPSKTDWSRVFPEELAKTKAVTCGTD